MDRRQLLHRRGLGKFNRSDHWQQLHLAACERHCRQCASRITNVGNPARIIETISPPVLTGFVTRNENLSTPGISGRTDEVVGRVPSRG